MAQKNSSQKDAQGRDARGAAQDKAQATAAEAKGQAQEVAQDAKAKAQEVAQTAQQEAGQLKDEAVQQAKSLAGSVQEQVGQQASTQQERVAGQVRSYTDDLHRIVSGEQPQNDAVRQAVSAVADRAEALTQRLETAQPADLLDDVRRFAARKPGTFLAIALGVGLVAGRATRGLRDAGQDEHGQAGRLPAQHGAPYAPRRAYAPEGVQADVTPHHLDSQVPAHSGDAAAQGQGLPYGTQPIPATDPFAGEVDAPFDQTRQGGRA